MPHDEPQQDDHHNDDHGHDDDHGSELSEMDLRVRALESLLVEKGYVDPKALDIIIETYESKVGPRNGARVVAKAWSDPAPGQWGTSATFYNDYRYARRPDEQLSVGRIFRIKEEMTLQIRVEFFNAFNRTYLNNPRSQGKTYCGNTSIRGGWRQAKCP